MSQFPRLELACLVPILEISNIQEIVAFTVVVAK